MVSMWIFNLIAFVMLLRWMLLCTCVRQHAELKQSTEWPFNVSSSIRCWVQLGKQCITFMKASNSVLHELVTSGLFNKWRNKIGRKIGQKIVQGSPHQFQSAQLRNFLLFIRIWMPDRKFAEIISNVLAVFIGCWSWTSSKIKLPANTKHVSCFDFVLINSDTDRNYNNNKLAPKHVWEGSMCIVLIHFSSWIEKIYTSMSIQDENSCWL